MGRRRFAVLERVLRSGSLQTDLEWAAAAGMAGIGLHGSGLAGHSTEEVSAMLTQIGLPASSVDGKPAAIELRPDSDTIRAAEERLRGCARLGAPGIHGHVGPLGGRSFTQADRDVHRALDEIGPIAVTLGVRVMIEPVIPLLTPASFVHTLGHALELVADHPGAGIALDVAHLHWDPRFYDDLRAAIGKVVTVQVADVDPAAAEDYRYARCQLGEGLVPLEEMLLAIDDAGYDGFYEFESTRRMPRSERPAYLKAAREWFESFWARHDLS